MKSPVLLLSILLITAISISCSDDEAPAAKQPVVVFEMEIDEIYHTGATDNWVIVHNEDGELLGVESFESGDQIRLDSTAVPERIGITLVRVEIATGAFTVDTYLNQEPGAICTLRPEIASEDQGSHVGFLDVKVSDPNLGSIYDSEISSPYTDGLSAKTAGADIIFSQRVATTEKKHLVFVTDKNGAPFYKLLAPGLSGSFTYSLEDFTPYEKTVEFGFPSSAQYFIDVRAFEEDQNPLPYRGYHGNIYWDGYFTNVAKTSVKLGFAAQFPNYRIDAAIVYPNYELGYNYFGPAPTDNIQLTNDITATVSNKTFSSHSISGSDYGWHKSFWQVLKNSNPHGFITVHSSPGSFANLQAIPAQITATYPLVTTTNFLYTGSYLYKGTKSYETLIAEEFKNADRSPFELTFKTVH